MSTHEEELELITENLDEIRSEALEILGNLTEWTNTTHHVERNGGQGGWFQFPLFSWGERAK